MSPRQEFGAGVGEVGAVYCIGTEGKWVDSVSCARETHGRERTWDRWRGIADKDTRETENIGSMKWLRRPIRPLNPKSWILCRGRESAQICAAAEKQGFRPPTLYYRFLLQTGSKGPQPAGYPEPTCWEPLAPVPEQPVLKVGYL